MKILAAMKYKALSRRKNGWPAVSTAAHIASEAIGPLARNALGAGQEIARSEHGSASWSDNCFELSRMNSTGGNVKVLSKEKCQVVAERYGWSLERARGYVDGEICRLRSKKPSKYALVGIDEYSAGFRAGYYERRNGASAKDGPRITDQA